MLVADMYGRQEKTINDMTLKSAVLIGCAQALALIPGHQPFRRHHDGRTVPEFHPPDAARFSFLLGIPATAAAIVLTLGDAVKAWLSHHYRRICWSRRFTFVAGILAIAFLMNLLRRISFLPFVLYRMVLGGFLLVLVYGYGAHLPPAPEGNCGPGQPAAAQSAPAPQ